MVAFFGVFSLFEHRLSYAGKRISVYIQLLRTDMVRMVEVFIYLSAYHI